MISHSPTVASAALRRLRLSRSASLRVLKIIVALISLSPLAACNQYPFGLREREKTDEKQEVICVGRDIEPPETRYPICDADDNGDEEQDPTQVREAATSERTN